jgi:hypothetical protein
MEQQGSSEARSKAPSVRDLAQAGCTRALVLLRQPGLSTDRIMIIHTIRSGQERSRTS